ncbi:hypothetical protein AX774_g5364 [Zancudomyces culisetae]|uniref:RGS domain-containing protein n=1 Tax=Zancudomyces culisetae TaxID=1213189 RepID=A0A1R1PJN7_ZANCU|nr:hypothetical protein AX774_g5364 [Zancudomyces culisetae]|eukprot:OMH81185.1 hypothetical protein AX774_g5364 [Zancudomyces culisetae]
MNTHIKNFSSSTMVIEEQNMLSQIKGLNFTGRLNSTFGEGFYDMLSTVDGLNLLRKWAKSRYCEELVEFIESYQELKRVVVSYITEYRRSTLKSFHLNSDDHAQKNVLLVPKTRLKDEFDSLLLSSDHLLLDKKQTTRNVKEKDIDLQLQKFRINTETSNRNTKHNELVESPTNTRPSWYRNVSSRGRRGTNETGRTDTKYTSKRKSVYVKPKIHNRYEYNDVTHDKNRISVLYNHPGNTNTLLQRGENNSDPDSDIENQYNEVEHLIMERYEGPDNKEETESDELYSSGDMYSEDYCSGHWTEREKSYKIPVSQAPGPYSPQDCHTPTSGPLLKNTTHIKGNGANRLKWNDFVKSDVFVEIFVLPLPATIVESVIYSVPLKNTYNSTSKDKTSGHEHEVDARALNFDNSFVESNLKTVSETKVPRPLRIYFSDIFLKFFCEDSSSMINVPGSLVRSLSKMHSEKTMTYGMFDTALENTLEMLYHNIYSLISKD